MQIWASVFFCFGVQLPFTKNLGKKKLFKNYLLLNSLNEKIETMKE